MTESKRRPKPYRTPDSKVGVYMTEPRWRALAAVLYSALSITTDPIHRKLIMGLYDDIEKQVNVEIHPVVMVDGEDPHE